MMQRLRSCGMGRWGWAEAGTGSTERVTELNTNTLSGRAGCV